MKTQNTFALICCILSLTTSHAFSQFALNEKDNYNYQTSIIVKANNRTNTNAFMMNSFAANIKVQRSFIFYFGEAAENNWSMVDNNYLNRFHLNGILTNALFDKTGNLIYTITYGTEKNLPADIRKIVKREYYDYAITMAIEVKENNRDIWVVKLDDTTEQITVRIEDGEMEQVQQFQKLN